MGNTVYSFLTCFFCPVTGGATKENIARCVQLNLKLKVNRLYHFNGRSGPAFLTDPSLPDLVLTCTLKAFHRPPPTAELSVWEAALSAERNWPWCSPENWNAFDTANFSLTVRHSKLCSFFLQEEICPQKEIKTSHTDIKAVIFISRTGELDTSFLTSHSRQQPEERGAAHARQL
jgi:hypothetical protein